MRKPSDVLAEGLTSKNSRGKGTAKIGELWVFLDIRRTYYISCYFFGGVAGTGGVSLRFKVIATSP
jgi:hypothetical protein